MSVPTLGSYEPGTATAYDRGAESAESYGGPGWSVAASPFAPASLSGGADVPAAPAPPSGQVLVSPFAEAAVAADDGEHTADAVEALVAELDDSEFAEALAGLADEAAARHLRSVGTWSSDSEAPSLAVADTTEWMAEVTEEADRILGALESYFADRPADSLRDGEIEAVCGPSSAGYVDPHDAQEALFGKLLDKAKKLAQGVGKLAKKGLEAAGKLLPLGKLFGILRRLVRPLLENVLRRAIGRLPASLRPLAGRLAARLNVNGGPPPEQGAGPEVDAAEAFDRTLAEAVLAPNDAAAERLLAEAEPPPGYQPEFNASHELDAARARLVRELMDADTDVPPTAQLEQFIPAVMAAMPLIRMGVRLVGRDRVVSGIATPLAQLIKGMVGAQGAALLSRHIASAGLGLLGLEAECGHTASLGAEALAAATEDTVRQAMSLPPESLENGLLLATEVQEAFAEAAARHLPAAVLRPELAEREPVAGRGVWIMMPRATRPCFRYRKYSVVIPVRVSRLAAREVVLGGGDTLERRLLDAGAESWPVEGDVELYELLPGGELGQLAAFESEGAGDAAAAVGEFEQLSASAATLLTGNPGLASFGRHGVPAQHRHPGSRYFRFRYRGRPLRWRHLFGLRLDLTAPQPVLHVHLSLGERETHLLSEHLRRRQLVQVVSVIRGRLNRAGMAAMAHRLERMLARHGVAAGAGAGQRLAERLADAMLRAVAEHLQAAAPALAQAARDPAPGATLSFTFAFADRAAMAAGTPTGDPTLTIRPGQYRG
jgi:hypothetical protein